MSYNAKCPYCGNYDNIDLSDVDVNVFDEEMFTHECGYCGKMFQVWPDVRIELDTKPCKCQCENHEWKISVTFPRCFSRMVCPHCGEEREPTQEEKQRYNIPSRAEYIKSLEKGESHE